MTAAAMWSPCAHLEVKRNDLFGVALWVFALYGMAHLVAGMKPFLGFTGIAWVALWGHVIYALVAAAVLETRGVVMELPKARDVAFG